MIRHQMTQFLLKQYLVGGFEASVMMYYSAKPAGAQTTLEKIRWSISIWLVWKIHCSSTYYLIIIYISAYLINFPRY